MTTRTFDTGATRNSDDGKLDFDGFLSPAVMRAFAEYMERHRHLEDGTLRASDNWQKGIPLDAYMKSMWRHFFSIWEQHRAGTEPTMEELCALMFNVQGYIHETLKAQQQGHHVFQFTDDKPDHPLKAIFDEVVAVADHASDLTVEQIVKQALSNLEAGTNKPSVAEQVNRAWTHYFATMAATYPNVP